jgi:diguanylate cyclase (GGDEF)-like protein
MINDSLGHLVGDQLLVAVAQRLQASLRPQDTLARLGDEFVVLLEDLQALTDVPHAAARIQEALRAPFQVSGHEVVTSASIGIALSTSGYAQPVELLRDADTAMYHAKASGTARTVIFEPAMHAAVQTRVALEQDLRRALTHAEFRLHYQPIVSVPRQTITAVEALVRWQHPTRGLLPPADFIPIAEDTGLIAPLGEWVLRAACAQTKAWHDAGWPLRVAVNLSPRQVQHSDVPTLLGAILADTGLPAAFLTVELTESDVMEQLEVAGRVLAAVHALGVQVALDDFGTGSSALTYLTRLPVTRVKLNHTFVHEVTTDAPRAALARGILALAQSLRLGVTAEGIETVDQVRFFQAAQADALQGYLVGRPMEANTLTTYLKQAAPTIAALLRGADADRAT